MHVSEEQLQEALRRGFTSQEVFDFLGTMSYRRMHYLMEHKIVEPSIVKPVGQGTPVRYSLRDVQYLYIIERCRKAGLTQDATNRVIRYLRDLPEPAIDGVYGLHAEALYVDDSGVGDLTRPGTPGAVHIRVLVSPGELVEFANRTALERSQ